MAFFAESLTRKEDGGAGETTLKKILILNNEVLLPEHQSHRHPKARMIEKIRENICEKVFWRKVL